MTIDVGQAREAIGKLWGLERALTKAELARALGLSPVNGGDYVARLEKGSTMSGPVRTAIEMMLDGAKPRHMEDVIKPGYPRGPVV